ncbi:MAG: zinc-dependent alcohol dehydrogenase family protein [Planctomycetota bacterium]|nr:zinc-dependent alcohol dehydrogenase family protein [Planctomycetota bacterium]
MKAMVLTEQGCRLKKKDIEKPVPEEGQVRLEVQVCGICRTDLHVLDGDLDHPKLPLVMGHQIVGKVDKVGKGVTKVSQGDKIGVPWLGESCGKCYYCVNDMENLCDNAIYTGYHRDGGFAEYCVAHEDYCFPIPEGYPDLQAAPLLCAGLIGYRSFRKTGDAKRIGFYGFGASAHILCQVAGYFDREVYAFTREGDKSGQAFARELGSVWAGASTERPPVELDAAIIFAPAGHLVVEALKSLRKGGRLVCAGIHMSDIPSFPYELLWGEREIVSVANLTRRDGEEFMAIAPKVPVKTTVHEYPLERTNEALEDLRNGAFDGAAVIRVAQIEKPAAFRPPV